MDNRELQNLILADTIEHKKELSRQLIELKHNARGCVLQRLGWTGGYLADFERDGSSYKRNIVLVNRNDNVTDVVNRCIEESGKRITQDPAYAKLECYLFGKTDQKESLTEYAEYGHNVSLTIYDIEEITRLAKNTEYLKNALMTDGEQARQSLKLDRERKIICDLFTTGAAVADIKNSFVSSFIQLSLYEHDGVKPIDLKEMVGYYLTNMSDTVFDNSLEGELLNKRVVYNDVEGMCQLSDEFRSTMDDMMASTSATERLLYVKFEECLGSYGIQDLSKKVIEKIMAIYQSHYKGETDLFNSHDNNDKRDRKLYNALIDLIQGKGKTITEARKITRELLAIVGESEYLNKTSLTGMLTGMFNSGQLEEYMSKQQRIVFLDTQILLNIICLLHRNVDNRDMLYDSTVMLWKQLKESRDYVKLYTTNGYVEEVANHLCEAYSLSRFLALPYIRDLGTSKNVFFNFYLYLTEQEEESYDGFGDYLSEMLGFDEVIPSGVNEIRDFFYGITVDIFEASQIEIKTMPIPEDLNIYQEEYKLVMNRCNMWYKNHGSRTRDILCSHYLSDESNFINLETTIPETPFLITMDRTMFPYMKTLSTKYHRKPFYVYPPVKFANRLSVMNLKIDASKVNYNIICLTEKNFNANSETMAMMDVISQIMSGSTLEGKSTPQKLAALKRSQQDDVKAKDFATQNNDSLPIDVVLTDVFRHYRQIGRAKLQLLSNLFENNDKTEDLIKVLSKYCKRYMDPRTLKTEKMFEEIDKLM